MATLTEETTAVQNGAKAKLGEKFAIIQGQVDELKSAGIEARVVKVGSPAPEFILPDAFGNEISLSGLLEKGPVVICFYRGSWCPFCNLELRAYQHMLSDFEATGATLVAISPEKADFAGAIIEKNDLTFPVLSDLHNVVARQFGLVFVFDGAARDFARQAFGTDIPKYNGDDTWELPMPGTFVLDREGVIRYAHADANYQTGRAEPSEVLKALQAL